MKVRVYRNGSTDAEHTFIDIEVIKILFNLINSLSAFRKNDIGKRFLLCSILFTVPIKMDIKRVQDDDEIVIVAHVTEETKRALKRLMNAIEKDDIDKLLAHKIDNVLDDALDKFFEDVIERIRSEKCREIGEKNDNNDKK